MPSQPSPPDSHYLWLGRIVSACSMLEIQLGMIGWTATKAERWTEDWFSITGSWARAQQLLRRGLPRLSPELADAVNGLVNESRPLRDERDALAHATFVVDPQTTLVSSPWLIRTTRNVERSLISDQQGASLVMEMNRLSRRAGELRTRVFEYVRE